MKSKIINTVYALICFVPFLGLVGCGNSAEKFTIRNDVTGEVYTSKGTIWYNTNNVSFTDANTGKEVRIYGNVTIKEQ